MTLNANDVQEIRAFFFGDETEKRECYERFIIPYFSRLNVDYYVDRDWNGGPNYRVLILGKPISIDDFREAFSFYIQETFGKFEISRIKNNVVLYEKQKDNLGEMERRDVKEIELTKHSCVESLKIDETYVKQRFHSFEHFLLHTKSLCIAQKFVNRNLSFFLHGSREEILIQLSVMLRNVLTFSKFEEGASVLVYVSNIEGVLAIAKQRNLKKQYEKAFNAVYDHIRTKLDSAFKEKNDLQDDWLDTMRYCFGHIEKNIDVMNVHTEGYYSQEDQRTLLLNNISTIESPFHTALKEKNLGKLLEHEEHLLFKVFMNVIYIIINQLGVNFNDKNIAMYMVIRSIFEETNGNWESVLMERGEVF